MSGSRRLFIDRSPGERRGVALLTCTPMPGPDHPYAAGCTAAGAGDTLHREALLLIAAHGMTYEETARICASGSPSSLGWCTKRNVPFFASRSQE